MDPLSNQIPPYSQYDIELYALQKPHHHVFYVQADIQQLKPFEVMSSELKKKSSKNKKDKQEKPKKQK